MDFLPMKGIEYLMVIAYLLLLVPFWMVLMGRQKQAAPQTQPHVAKASGLRSWFEAPEQLAFHPGHAWAQSLAGNRMRIGMDDFSNRLIGPAEKVFLPKPGSELVAGEAGWQLQANEKTIPILSPVTGRVIRVNEAALESPDAIGGDPYGQGWLMEIEVPSVRSAMKNLIQGKLAQLWTEDTAERISRRMSPELGMVLADGGTPVAGLARAVAGDDWLDLTEEMLLLK